MESEKPWDRPWSVDEIRANSSNWNLAGDAGLLNHLQKFSKDLLSNTHNTQTALDSLTEDLNATTTDVSNITNTFLSLANTQFVENRVYDDDDKESPVDIKSSDKVKTKEELEAETIAQIKEAITLGMSMLDSMFERIDVPGSDSEDEESLASTSRVILKPRNPYMNRPLPFLIGSREFMEDEKVGLGELLNDEDYNDEEEEEEEAGGLSSESEADLQRLASISGSENSEPESERSHAQAQPEVISESPPEAEISHRTKKDIFSEELAAKLGATVAGNSSFKQDNLFASPPEEDTMFNPSKDEIFTWNTSVWSTESGSSKDKKQSLFDENSQDEDDDSLFQKQPSSVFGRKSLAEPVESSTPVSPKNKTGLFDDSEPSLFQNISDIPNLKHPMPYGNDDDLFSNKSSDLKPTDNFKDQESTNEKPQTRKPFGGIDVFNKLSEHVHLQSSDSSESEDEANKAMITSNIVSNQSRLSKENPSSLLAKSESGEDNLFSVTNSTSTLSKLSNKPNLFSNDELFKAHITDNNTSTLDPKSLVIDKNQPTKSSLGLFSEISDDINDDLFSVSKQPISKQSIISKNDTSLKSNLFAEELEDDIFAVHVKKPKTVEPKPISDLFSGIDDIFAPSEPPLSITSPSKHKTLNSKKMLKLFDEDDVDDLLFEPNNLNIEKESRKIPESLLTSSGKIVINPKQIEENESFKEIESEKIDVNKTENNFVQHSSHNKKDVLDLLKSVDREDGESSIFEKVNNLENNKSKIEPSTENSETTRGYEEQKLIPPKTLNIRKTTDILFDDSSNEDDEKEFIIEKHTTADSHDGTYHSKICSTDTVESRKAKLNLDPRTLLPGAKPIPKPCSKDVTASFDHPARNNEILTSAGKDRVKIQVKRRPQSRRARHEALRASAADLIIEDTIVKKSPVELLIDSDHSKDVMNINTNVLSPSTDEEDFFSVPAEYAKNRDKIVEENSSLFKSAPVISPLDVPFGESPVSENIKAESANEDLFSEQISVGTKLPNSLFEEMTPEKSLSVIKTEADESDIFSTQIKKNFPDIINTASKEKLESLFQNNESDDLFSGFSTSKKITYQKTNNSSKVNEPFTRKADQYLDDLFSSEPLEENSIFSDNILFNSKDKPVDQSNKIGKTNEKESQSTLFENKTIDSGSLFGDDSPESDNLFSTAIMPQRKIESSTKKTSIFDDDDDDYDNDYSIFGSTSIKTSGTGKPGEIPQKKRVTKATPILQDSTDLFEDPLMALKK